MRQRIRVTNKIGKGTYHTTSFSVGEYAFVKCFYWLFMSIFYMMKYIFYVPTKYIIQKIFENKDKNN